MKIAVITIDVVNSSKLSAEELGRLMSQLEEEVLFLKKKKKISYYESFRGDSMQMIIPQPIEALKIAFILKTSANSLSVSGLSKRGDKIFSDIRVAIGIGPAEHSSLSRMTNEAPFVRSGKQLDQIEKEDLGVGVTTGKKSIDRELQTALYLYEGIQKRWTLPVAEIVYHKLKDKTEQIIANELNISQSAVNQRSHSAYWNGLNVLLMRYRELITELLDE